MEGNIPFNENELTRKFRREIKLKPMPEIHHQEVLGGS